MGDNPHVTFSEDDTSLLWHRIHGALAQNDNAVVTGHCFSLSVLSSNPNKPTSSVDKIIQPTLLAVLVLDGDCCASHTAAGRCEMQSMGTSAMARFIASGRIAPVKHKVDPSTVEHKTPSISESVPSKEEPASTVADVVSCPDDLYQAVLKYWKELTMRGRSQTLMDTRSATIVFALEPGKAPKAALTAAKEESCLSRLSGADIPSDMVHPFEAACSQLEECINAKLSSYRVEGSGDKLQWHVRTIRPRVQYDGAGVTSVIDYYWPSPPIESPSETDKDVLKREFPRDENGECVHIWWMASQTQALRAILKQCLQRELSSQKQKVTEYLIRVRDHPSDTDAVAACQQAAAVVQFLEASIDRGMSGYKSCTGLVFRDVAMGGDSAVSYLQYISDGKSGQWAHADSTKQWLDKNLQLFGKMGNSKRVNWHPAIHTKAKETVEVLVAPLVLPDDHADEDDDCKPNIFTRIWRCLTRE